METSRYSFDESEGTVDVSSSPCLSPRHPPHHAQHQPKKCGFGWFWCFLLGGSLGVPLALHSRHAHNHFHSKESHSSATHARACVFPSAVRPTCHASLFFPTPSLVVKHRLYGLSKWCEIISIATAQFEETLKARTFSLQRRNVALQHFVCERQCYHFRSTE